jgi:hypothetical protein
MLEHICMVDLSRKKKTATRRAFFLPNPGTYEKGAPGTKEASCLKHRDNVALQLRKILALAIEVKGLLERLHG